MHRGARDHQGDERPGTSESTANLLAGLAAAIAKLSPAGPARLAGMLAAHHGASRQDAR